MSVPSLLDHVVLAGPDLEAAIDHVHRLTGVRAERGGRHPGGTANALIALTRDGARGTQYLEIIGPDPDREGNELPETFGIATLTEPRVVAYAIHPRDIEAQAAQAATSSHDPGPVEPLSRRTEQGTLLEWRLTRSRAALPAYLPFLIDWGETPQPGLTTGPELEVRSFTATVPDVWSAAEAATAFGSDIRFETGDGVTLRLTVDGPKGEVTLI